MTYVLNHRQREALKILTHNKAQFMPFWRMPERIGKATLNSLVDLGLAETAPTNRLPGEIGWRISDNGWRCIYGKTYAEIVTPGALSPYPLEIWSWPPSRP